jgi:hypothetical protein
MSAAVVSTTVRAAHSRVYLTLLHSENEQDFVTAARMPPFQTPEPSALPVRA